MNIQILSDIHLEFEAFELNHSQADVVVLAGDIGVGTSGIQWVLDVIKDKPVIYVFGNHEFYKNTHPKLIRKAKEMVAGTQVHILENESLEIDSIVFYGCTLWTDFELFGNAPIAGYECQQKMTDFKKIRTEPKYSKLRSIDVARIHKQSVNWLKRTLDATNATKRVVVTHHSPSPLSIPEQYSTDIVSAAYASKLEPLIENMQPDIWIHGHIHESCDYRIGATRVTCNPRGYPEEQNEAFDPMYRVII